MLCFVGNITPKVAPNDAMPRGVVFLVELLLDICRDILLNVVLLQCLGSAIDSVLLHVLGHLK